MELEDPFSGKALVSNSRAPSPIDLIEGTLCRWMNYLPINTFGFFKKCLQMMCC
jgi:hypothetical protein